MNKTDQIQRVMDLPVDLSRAWRAISTPGDLSQWFSDRVSFDPNVSAVIIFDWDNHGKKYGQIEIIEEPYRFAFRWLAGDTGLNIPITENNSTLVVFELVEIAEGTRLTVTESGFSKLPTSDQTGEFSKNIAGWDYELNDLENYFKDMVN